MRKLSLDTCILFATFVALSSTPGKSFASSSHNNKNDLIYAYLSATDNLPKDEQDAVAAKHSDAMDVIKAAAGGKKPPAKKPATPKPATNTSHHSFEKTIKEEPKQEVTHDNATAKPLLPEDDKPIIPTQAKPMYSYQKGSLGWNPFFRGLPDLLENDYLVKAAEFTKEGADSAQFTALSAYFPTLTIDTKFGKERIINDTTDNTSYATAEVDFTATQLVTDFGRTLGAWRQAKADYQRNVNTLRQVRQDRLRAAIDAYMDVVRDRIILANTERNARRIKEQLALEEERIKAGQGSKTDKMQVQAQLEGTRALIVQAKANLEVSLNDYRTVFHHDAPSQKSMKMLPMPDHLLPKTMDDAINVAFQKSPTLLALENVVQSAREALGVSQAAFFPTISLEGAAEADRNVSGVAGSKGTYKYSLEMSYPIINGGGDVTRMRTAKDTLYAAEARYHQQQLATVQQVRDDWIALKSSQERFDRLMKQGGYLEEFFQYVQEERKLNKRTLLDILVADTNVISAQTQATTAKATMIKSAYGLLDTMGMLTINNLLGA